MDYSQTNTIFHNTINDNIIAHAHITAHPQTMENVYLFSLFINDRIRACPQTLEDPNLTAHGHMGANAVRYGTCNKNQITVAQAYRVWGLTCLVP